MKRKCKILIIFADILLVLFVICITAVKARYVINKQQSITISSVTSSVDITIDKTTGNLASQTSTVDFKVTIKNNNNYPIVYTIENFSSYFTLTGGDSDVSLAANSSVDVTITLSTKSGVVYIKESDPATITVNITEPYKISKSFELTISTFNYNLRELQLDLLYKDKIKTGADFTENVTTEEGSGIFTMTDETSTSYYYRGVINYNYVYFAEKLWRIIRVNGDGSYRIILDEHAGKSAFAKTSDTTYNNVGYMYAKASDYRANTYSSTIKDYLESWYSSNIEASYDNYVDKNAIFWQDRNVYTTTSNGYIVYAGWNRMINHTPTLKPGTTTAEKKDWFSVTTTKGNGKLSKPIGLITADEVALAGAKTDATLEGFSPYYANTEYYLNLSSTSPYGIWTMTPRRFAPSNGYNSHTILAKPQASIYSEPSFHDTTTRYVKPVINLKSTIMVKGNGTKDYPYVVKSAS